MSDIRSVRNLGVAEAAVYRWQGRTGSSPGASLRSGGARRGNRGLRVRISDSLVRDDPGQRRGDQYRCNESDHSVGFHELSPFTCLAFNRFGVLSSRPEVAAVSRGDVAREFPYPTARFHLKCATPFALTRT